MFTLLLLSLSTLASTSESAAVFSHDLFSQVLSRIVSPEGLVDYQALAADRESFDDYLGQIRQLGPQTSPERFPDRDHRLAYYLNAYNALVLEAVLEGWMDADSVWGWGTGFRFFVARKFELEGRRTNLKSLEDRDVREAFEDPRIHAALNCGSLGCPRLRPEAFHAEALDRQLEEAMSEMASDLRHCRVEPESKTVSLSKIFDWFRQDFVDWGGIEGRGDAGLIAYVNRFRSKEDAIPTDYLVRFLDYDKGLNHR